MEVSYIFILFGGRDVNFVDQMYIKTMTKETAIKVLDQKQIRSVWSEKDEKWYFSIVDVIAILTESLNPRKYWSDLKTRLKKEGSQLSQKIGQLKLLSSDGKFYKTDVADTK